MNKAIQVEGLSKAYQLGQFNTGTLSHDLERWWALFRGKEDPFLKVGEQNDRTRKGVSNVVWSLKDINFEIAQGDAVGIIGRNGAGKSTLLKILSRVTSPTTGSVKVKGRIASLLEVGTGFHPELTGKENIFLNGAILGMRKQEIKRKFDEIVDFAGVDRYIDTPVKRYSSGMYVRLAFAVAAHLESEILIVDEVLAVGDAEFQKKCLGKMDEVSRGEGRTVLFVSHNMSSVQALCSKGLFVNNGEIQNGLSLEECVSLYFNASRAFLNAFNPQHRKGSQRVIVENISVRCSNSHISAGDECLISFQLSQKISYPDKYRVDLRINSTRGSSIGWLSTELLKDSFSFPEIDRLTFVIPKLPLNKGLYSITYCLFLNNDVSDWCQNAYLFEVHEGLYYSSGLLPAVEQSEILLDYKIC